VSDAQIVNTAPVKDNPVKVSVASIQFPPNMRSSGISLGYNGASLVAGVLPFIATAVYGTVGWVGPATMFSLLGVISTLCGTFTRETAPIKTGLKTKAYAVE
jgi:hypothetical protein